MTKLTPDLHYHEEIKEKSAHRHFRREQRDQNLHLVGTFGATLPALLLPGRCEASENIRDTQSGKTLARLNVRAIPREKFDAICEILQDC